MLFGSLQYLIIFVLSVLTFAAAVWALIQGLRFPNSAYVAAGKLQRQWWVLILVGALVVSFLGLPPPLGFGKGVLGFGVLIAITAVAIFFIDVLPKLRENYRPGTSKPRDNRGGW